MKTKHIPVMTSLVAGLVTCIVAFASHLSMRTFGLTFVLVVVGFYILGCVIKFVFDKNFPPEEPKEAAAEGTEEGAAEGQELGEAEGQAEATPEAERQEQEQEADAPQPASPEGESEEE